MKSKQFNVTEMDLKVGQQLMRDGYNTIQDIIASDTSLKESRIRDTLVKHPRQQQPWCHQQRHISRIHRGKPSTETTIPTLTHAWIQRIQSTVHNVIACTEFKMKQ
jgi:nicotinic acid phosphoribosyltransferase